MITPTHHDPALVPLPIARGEMAGGCALGQAQPKRRRLLASLWGRRRSLPLALTQPWSPTGARVLALHIAAASRGRF